MPRFPHPSGGHRHPPIVPAPTATSSSQQSSPTSISPTASPSPSPPPPTTTPVSATSVMSTPPVDTTPPPSPPPPSPIASAPSSVGALSPDPVDGGQTQTNGGNPPASPDSNANLQPMQSASQISGFSQSTWIVVNSATPTTMTFSSRTMIGGSLVDTTWAITTSVGGQTSTMSSNIPNGTGSTRSDTTNSSPSSVHSSSHLGAIIGSIVGAIIVASLILLACKVYYHRRTVLRQERQMTENWISRSFSRALRHGYRDVDMPAEVPAAHARSDSHQDILFEKDSDSFTMRSLSPTPSSTIMSSFGDSNRRRPASELIDAQNGRRSVTMCGDQTVPLLGLSTLPPQDPFLDPLDADLMMTRSFLSSPARTENDTEPSRSSTVTDDNIIFNRPVSRSSSTLEHHYQSPTGRYTPDPFSDSASPHSPSSSTVMDGNGSSVGSTVQILPPVSSPISPIGVHVSGRGLIRGPNLTALMDEVHRD